MTQEVSWIDNPLVLFDNLSERSSYIPDKEDSITAKKNAFVRVVVLVVLIYSFVENSYKSLYIMILAFIFLLLKQYIEKPESPESAELTYECKKPIISNPMMNTLVTDFGKPEPEACNADDEDIRKEMRVKFDENFEDQFGDFQEVHDKKNFKRHFVNIRTGYNPEDQDKFVKFLFNDLNKDSCKVNQDRCFRYGDLRYNSNRYVR